MDKVREIVLTERVKEPIDRVLRQLDEVLTGLIHQDLVRQMLICLQAVEIVCHIWQFLVNLFYILPVQLQRSFLPRCYIEPPVCVFYSYDLIDIRGQYDVGIARHGDSITSHPTNVLSRLCNKVLNTSHEAITVTTVADICLIDTQHDVVL